MTRFLPHPLHCSDVALLCLKDSSLQGELMKEKKDMEPVESKKQRLASVTSSESFASSGFQEDKSLSDVEEDEEGRY